MEDLLQIGTKIKIGKNYSKDHGFKEGEIITLVDGEFEEENGLYAYTSNAPAVWNDYGEEFDSIYHLFGNSFENWMDNEIIN